MKYAKEKDILLHTHGDPPGIIIFSMIDRSKISMADFMLGLGHLGHFFFFS